MRFLIMWIEHILELIKKYGFLFIFNKRFVHCSNDQYYVFKESEIDAFQFSFLFFQAFVIQR